MVGPRPRKKIENITSGLQKSGISNITVSVDESHLRGKSSRLINYLLEQLVSKKIPTTVSCTSDEEHPKIPINLPTSNIIKSEFHYISPVGLAKEKKYTKNAKLNFAESRCPMSKSLTLSIWPDGTVYPCCSTYVVNKETNISIGNINNENLIPILERALSDSYLCAIREIGFSGVCLLLPNSDIWKSVFEMEIVDVCHLCARVAATGKVDHLRKQLTDTLDHVINLPQAV